MRQADLSRQKNQNLSELEAEARDRAQYLLERANTLRMEQEDEVKKLNEVDKTTVKSQTIAATHLGGCILQRSHLLATYIMLPLPSSPAVSSGSAVPCRPGCADSGEETEQCRMVRGREETGCHDGGGASPGLRNPGTN